MILSAALIALLPALGVGVVASFAYSKLKAATTPGLWITLVAAALAAEVVIGTSIYGVLLGLKELLD